MKNLTIGRRITLGFVSVLLILFLFGLFIHSRVLVVRNGMRNVSTTSIPALEYLTAVQAGVNASMSLVYKHIYSDSAADMNGLEANISSYSQTISSNLEAFEKLASPDAKVLLEQLKSNRKNYVAMRSEILVLSHDATNALASAEVYKKARTDLDPLAAAYMDSVVKCQTQEKKEADDSSNSVLSATSATDLSLSIGGLVALLVAGGLAWVIIRSTNAALGALSRSLSDSSNQVASAASQVSSASQTLAQGSGEQAASIEETSASLEEMASMTKRNAENAQSANELAREARAAAERGSGDMHAMTAAMQSIKGSSDDVAKIIKTIDEIAFQTNILALNAAVEAARAGEAGMGFAVVADEVRNLAQRSAQAAKETAAKIEGAISNTSQGVQISAKVAEALVDIVSKVRQVDELITEVSSASREQTLGITQVNTAVGEMDKVTQSNAASAEESAAAAEELNAQALTLKQSVTELMVLVDGVRNHPAMASVPKAHQAPAKSTARVHTVAPSKTIRAQKPLPSSNRRSEIPLESDFKDM